MRFISLAATCLFVVALAADEPARQRRLEVSPSSSDDKFAALLDQYARGEISIELQPGASTLELQRQLRRTGSSWIGPRNAPDAGRRRLAVATLSLEIIDGNIATAWRAGFSGDLLEWSCGLLREVPATAAERTWHLAALAQLERASAFRLIRGSVSQATGNSRFVTHVVHAEGRFPDDGRWALARAIDAEHAVWPPPIDEETLYGIPDFENRIRSRLETAFEHPVVSSEARVRWGYFHLRRGRLEQALAELDAVGQPTDRALLYWQQFFRGQVLVRMNREPDAAAAYRLALSAFPRAQSATLSLATVLARNGQATESGDLVRAMLDAPPADDPWNIYGFPTYRLWPVWLRQLREAIAQ